MPLFTKENARRYAAKSHEVRRAHAAAERLAIELPVPMPQPDDGLPDEYLVERLVRVRKQLRRLDEMLLAEKDAQRLDRLASASSKLSEVERQLSGRPAPGAYRPTSPRRRTAGIAALIPE